jgi:DNA-binding NarL/FixJ family response regulator
MEKSLNVLILGKVPIVCSALANTISRNFRESFAITTTSSAEALALNEIVSFNLIIIDGDDYTNENLSVMTTIKKTNSTTKIIVLTYDEDNTFIRWCFKNGANAYLNKYLPEEKIIKIINLSINGNKYYRNDLVFKMPRSFNKKEYKSSIANLKAFPFKEAELAYIPVKGYKSKFTSTELNIVESAASICAERISINTSSNTVFKLFNKLKNAI